MSDAAGLWNAVLAKLEDLVPKAQLGDWISPLRPLSVENDALFLGVNNELHRTYLSKHYQAKLEDILLGVAGRRLQVRFVLDRQGQQDLLPAPAASSQTPQPRTRMPRALNEGGLPLNPKYIFETFVVGNSNRFAHAAAQGVAENLGRAHNPLFLYGGVGLGKTHLLQAIGHTIKSRHPGKRVVYTTSEKFANDMIKTIQDKNTAEFRRKYRNVDLLLIDDIQFFQGRESTQEEFFHTVNDLSAAQKQLVATSDSHPKDIKVEDRLKSRLQGGLTADLQAPDIETRIAILRKKSESENLAVDEDVLQLIAGAIHTNIRELEGALNRVVAYASTSGQAICMPLAQEALRDLLVVSRPAHTLARIQSAVATYFSLHPNLLSERTRTESVAYPRQLAMYLCRELLGSSYVSIGNHFGGRDHTTALYAIEKIRRLQDDPQTSLHLSDLRRALNA